MTGTAAIELYVGTAIKHASEREVLVALIEHLSSAGGWATIFANIHIGGRQIDFLVATDFLTLVVEAKYFSRRVRGKVNGLWQMHASGSAWKNVGNPYVQALDAMHALKDHLRTSHGEDLGYPATCVVIAPKLPVGSDVPPSDFKVSIIGVDGLAAVAAKTSGLLLSREKWTAFARELRLQRAETMSAACDPKLLEQKALLTAYGSEFLRTYAPDIVSLKPDSYGVVDEEFDAIRVADRVAQEGEDLLILGPSGCGKTLLAKKIAIHCLGQGNVPILLQAKYFAGKLGESIEREAVMLGAPSATGLIRAARATGSPLLLVLDGYNECPVAEQLVLTRSLAAAVRRFGARLVVSAQADIVRPDLIAARHVVVKEPGRALKEAIAGAGTKHRFDYLLDSVSSGFEADLVGRVGTTLTAGSSRFALFDAYARQRLGDDASEGIRFLAAVAGQLIDRMSFSLSIRDLDRLAAAQRVGGEVLGRIVGSGLVLKQSDKVSFRHELIFAAFAAESVVRRTNYDVENTLQALSAPKYRNARSLILGAYDDDGFVVKILAETTDADLLRAASDGECGLAARYSTVARCEKVLEKLTSEATAVRFLLQGGAWNEVCVCEDSASEWTAAEHALMATIADGVWRGSYLDQILHAVGVMDQSLSRSFQTLKDEARDKKIALRSGLFAAAYVMSGRTGISRLLRYIFNSDRVLRSSESKVADKLKIKWEEPRTPGQTYLLLSLVRLAEDKEFVVPYILPLLGEQWQYQPYHLQLEILNFVHFARLSDEQLRQKLISALDALIPSVGPVLSGMVIEALEHMGALEEEVSRHVDTVRTELQHLLSGPIDADKCGSAWGIYVCQFDHPYSAAYCEAMQELSPDDRKRVLAMACRGADNAGMFIAPLIRELVEHNDRSVAPAIEPWLELPAVESFMPQESVSVFVWAHVALGMLGVPLPARDGNEDSSAKAALIALGDLYYWIHRPDLEAGYLDQACAPALGVLLRPDQYGAASTLHMVTRSMLHEDGVRESVIRKFPRAMTSICRNALRLPDHQVGYFPRFVHDKRDVLRFSVDLIGSIGGMGDLPLLRNLSEDVDIGASAIKAIRHLEGRVSGIGG